jgi:hypothetical protein
LIYTVKVDGSKGVGVSGRVWVERTKLGGFAFHYSFRVQNLRTTSPNSIKEEGEVKAEEA